MEIRIWSTIRRRLGKAGRAKEMKKKAMTGIELVGAGALLTGGSVLMERLTKNNTPSISGQDIIYNEDNSVLVFKFESMSKEGNMRILETLAWIVFGFFVLLFILPIIRVIRKIMNFCKTPGRHMIWRPKQNRKTQKK